MLPFARLLASSFPDPSSPGTWYCTSDGGSSYLYGSRAWLGRDDDGNGYSYLYMPMSAPKGGMFRLSFRTTGEAVSCGGGGKVVLARPGLTQSDFRLSANLSAMAFIRTDATVDTFVTGITLEQLG